MLKVFELLPTPLNTANDLSASSFVNLRTQQETNAGGLVLGDCFDIDDQGAANLSNTAIGLCFQGRYRRVQVDANATAANVGIGKAAYVVPGTSLLAALTLTAGSGQTPGTYQIAAVGGGGTGAIIQVVVTAAGTVTANPTVVAKGSGYTTIPTFTVAAGGTPATVLAQMSENTYIVTSQDKAGINASQGRGVFLNTITPGNYGWIQENGVATFLVDSTAGTGTAGSVLSPVGATVAGAFRGIAVATAPLASAFGTNIDALTASVLVRGVLTLPVWNG